ncbi:bifunctional methylenetetrahydrofolate dehydrogenase/cyclohydrolase 2, mitochondrial [Hyla sarda]|uniref:bifunctional methylenetetrahydrofolate dehydrogenase/cyclohydrolase 2, mitochondrial n=1 Tax=Hyla sarda TaxID=327740 RepID=UPI0024C2F1AF|nr:bifunctional methylenetetrahydrofolate dehydrogenase/cyclohydrolase 2, mitochondrial [Hyla sarda]
MERWSLHSVISFILHQPVVLEELMASIISSLYIIQRTIYGTAKSNMTNWERGFCIGGGCIRTFYRSKAHVISGNILAKEIKREVQRDVESWLSLGNKRPHLSVILVGDNPASHTYVKNKIKAATTVGISSEIILKPSNVSQEELLQVISKLSGDSNVSGLLVQLPLPEHVNERDICNAIAPEKDVDGFHIVNIGRLCLDQSSIIPATAAAVWEIIKRTGIKTFGKNVVVVGRSKNVGMPISMLLHTDGRHERPGGDATVTITHRYTPKDLLKIHTQIADIIIVAAGIPNLITEDMVKEGAAVIDVGINHIEDQVTGKTILVGDVDFEKVKEKAGYITPVPGGVGPMTVAMLLKNTLMAAKKRIY